MNKRWLYKMFLVLMTALLILALDIQAYVSASGLSKSSAIPVSSNLSAPALASFNPSRLYFQELTSVSGLVDPVLITNAGDGSGRLFVLERTGRIRVIKDGSLLATPFLDIQSLILSGGEKGLLALAFHPSYASNGQFYVAYTAPRNGDPAGSNLILERFTVSGGNADQADPASGLILITIPHPGYGNHNGGTLAFGQDGYLYWSTGDGGGSGDPNNNAQSLYSMLGKILRIDVNAGSPYQVPASNPFSSSTDPNVKKEIWAYGLRNPWRMSFDRLTHDLYIGDVGQSAREEVNVQSPASSGGENYGWRVMEGSLCFDPSSGCDRSGKVLPVTEYDHSLGCAVTGGYVYRGTQYPDLEGYYFYGDFCSGRLFSLYKDPVNGWKSDQILDTPYQISTFGEDEQGELYLADYASGKIYKLKYASLDSDSAGVFRPSNGIIYLKNSNITGYADIAINYGIGGDYPIAGDWNRDGIDSIGVYRNGVFYLRNSNTVGYADVYFPFGTPGDQPIAGDWNGDGIDTIGVYRSSTFTFYLRNSNTTGPADYVFQLGIPGDVGIAGDWTGKRFDTVGVFRPSNGVIYLKNTNATGYADIAINYGIGGDKPVTGDWDNNGTDTIGVLRGNVFYLRNSNTVGYADMYFALGIPGDMPIAGNWDGLP